MTARAQQQGWPIVYVAPNWVYEDTGESIEVERSCRCCHQQPVNGCDACIGHVPGAISVCCGHGIDPPFIIWRGQDA